MCYNKPFITVFSLRLFAERKKEPNSHRDVGFGSAGADRTVQLGSLLSQIFGRRLDAIENGSLPLPAPVA